jgi:hypothetical protein
LTEVRLYAYRIPVPLSDPIAPRSVLPYAGTLSGELPTKHNVDKLIQQQIAQKIMDTDMIISIGNLLKTNLQLSTRLGTIMRDKRNAQSAGLDKVVSNSVYPKWDKPKDKEEKITHQRALITVLLKHRRNCVQGIVNTGSMINIRLVTSLYACVCHFTGTYGTGNGQEGIFAGGRQVCVEAGIT